MALPGKPFGPAPGKDLVAQKDGQSAPVPDDLVAPVDGTLPPKDLSVENVNPRQY